jgi:hypothetical protein
MDLERFGAVRELAIFGGLRDVAVRITGTWAECLCYGD